MGLQLLRCRHWLECHSSNFGINTYRNQQSILRLFFFLRLLADSCFCGEETCHLEDYFCYCPQKSDSLPSVQQAHNCTHKETFDYLFPTCTSLDDWWYSTNQGHPSGLSRPLFIHRYLVLVTSRVHVEGNPKCYCVPCLCHKLLSKTLQPEKRTRAGGVTCLFKGFVHEGLVRFSNSVSVAIYCNFFACCCFICQ